MMQFDVIHNLWTVMKPNSLLVHWIIYIEYAKKVDGIRQLVSPLDPIHWI